VVNLLARVKRWWNPTESSSPKGVPYAVECTCGRVNEGVRQPVRQVVACARCGARVFIFPQSAFPPVALSRVKGKRAPGQSAPDQWPRKWLLAVGLVVVALTGLAVWLVLDTLASSDEAGPPPVVLKDCLAEARAALAQGKFQTALRKLNLARSAPEYDGLSQARRRDLDQLHRQAALMADLLEVPLQDLLRHASDLPPGEWQLVFRRRYRGQALLLDAEVGRNAAGRYELDFPLFVGDEPARVEIGDLDLLRDLGLDQSCRLIVGARLAGVERDPSGAWVVRLRPDSGVFLTDRATLEVACPVLKKDQALDEVLQRQERWLAELP
jgi:hypothetical protein